MIIYKTIIKLFLIFSVIFFVCKSLISSEYNEIINKVYQERKLDSIEGVWIKVLANQGSTGCVTMFFKTKNNLYHQVHIDSCFVMEKVTGRHSKSSDNLYEGKNAVYFFDGTVNWGASKVKVSDDNNLIELTHISPTNTFTEKWKRIWPEDLVSYNKSLDKKNNK